MNKHVRSQSLTHTKRFPLIYAIGGRSGMKIENFYSLCLVRLRLIPCRFLLFVLLFRFLLSICFRWCVASAQRFSWRCKHFYALALAYDSSLDKNAVSSVLTTHASLTLNVASDELFRLRIGTSSIHSPPQRPFHYQPKALSIGAPRPRRRTSKFKATLKCDSFRWISCLRGG